jgi:hypothetical protein
MRNSESTARYTQQAKVRAARVPECWMHPEHVDCVTSFPRSTQSRSVGLRVTPPTPISYPPPHPTIEMSVLGGAELPHCQPRVCGGRGAARLLELPKRSRRVYSVLTCQTSAWRSFVFTTYSHRNCKTHTREIAGSPEIEKKSSVGKSHGMECTYL